MFDTVLMSSSEFSSGLKVGCSNVTSVCWGCALAECWVHWLLVNFAQLFLYCFLICFVYICFCYLFAFWRGLFILWGCYRDACFPKLILLGFTSEVSFGIINVRFLSFFHFLPFWCLIKNINNLIKSLPYSFLSQSRTLLNSHFSYFRALKWCSRFTLKVFFLILLILITEKKTTVQAL